MKAYKKWCHYGATLYMHVFKCSPSACIHALSMEHANGSINNVLFNSVYKHLAFAVTKYCTSINALRKIRMLKINLLNIKFYSGLSSKPQVTLQTSIWRCGGYSGQSCWNEVEHSDITGWKQISGKIIYNSSQSTKAK